MRLSVEALASALFLASLNPIDNVSAAFFPGTSSSPKFHLGISISKRKGNMGLMATGGFPPNDAGEGGTTKRVLRPADVISKAKSVGVLPSEDEEEVPKLFTESIYDDFQSALLKIEKRVKDGPGSLTAEEAKIFEEETSRIVEEMKEFMNDPEGKKKEIAASYLGAQTDAKVDSSAKPFSENISPAIQSAPKPLSSIPETSTEASLTAPSIAEPIVAATPPNAPLEASPNQGYGITDASNDEGPAYTGEGGFGLARGTTNTYAIPGMDEMSPEEYRAKLQESISARQAKRREESLRNRGGMIGNRSSSGYLDQLGRGSVSQGEQTTSTHTSSHRNNAIEASKKEQLHQTESTLPDSGNTDKIADQEQVVSQNQQSFQEGNSKKPQKRRRRKDVAQNKQSKGQVEPSDHEFVNVQKTEQSIAPQRSSDILVDEELQPKSMTQAKEENMENQDQELKELMPTPELKTIKQNAPQEEENRQLERQASQKRKGNEVILSQDAPEPSYTPRSFVLSTKPLVKVRRWWDEKIQRPSDYVGPRASSIAITPPSSAKNDPSSFIRSELNETNHWWNEKTQRPSNYVGPRTSTMTDANAGQKKAQTSTASNDPSSFVRSDLEETNHWWNEKTQRPSNYVGPRTSTMIDANAGQKQAQTSTTSNDPSSFVRSDLKETNHWWNEKTQRPSNYVGPRTSTMTGTTSGSKEAGQKQAQTSTKSSDPSSFIHSNLKETNHWWNESPKRPHDYVKSAGTLKTSISTRAPPPLNYGNVLVSGSPKAEVPRNDSAQASDDTVENSSN